MTWKVDLWFVREPGDLRRVTSITKEISIIGKFLIIRKALDNQESTELSKTLYLGENLQKY